MPQKRKSNRQRRTSNRPREQVGMPPQINMHPISVRKYRFVSGGSAATSVIYRRSMLSLQSVVIVLNTTAMTIIQAIRIRRVSVYAVSASGMQQISIEWLDPHGPSTQYSASATPTQPAKLSSVPPKGSFAELWSNVQYSGVSNAVYNEPLFQLETLADSIVDVECEVVYGDGNATTPPEYILRNIAGAALGVYYADLDNSSASGTAGTNTLNSVADAVVTYTS